MKRKIALAMVLAMTASMAQPVLAADSKTTLSSVSMVLRLRPGGLSLRKILKQRILISI